MTAWGENSENECGFSLLSLLVVPVVFTFEFNIIQSPSDWAD